MATRRGTTGIRRKFEEYASRAARPAMAVIELLRRRDPLRIIVSGNEGLTFAGNSRYLFEHLVKNTEFDAYWLTRSRRVQREVDSQFPGRALYWKDPRAIWLGASASTFFISHSTGDIYPHGLSSRGKRIIHLTHGTPLKAMGFMKAGGDDLGFTHETKRYGRLTCSSEFERDLWARCYRMDPGNIWVTGVPRNDILLRGASQGRQQSGLPEGRLVLFAPTFRDWEERPGFTPVPGVDPKDIQAILREQNAWMLLRPHYYQRSVSNPLVDAASEPGSRFILADEARWPDVSLLLPKIDVLVTDYSSIYIDYLLLDRPMIFTPYDLEEYRKRRGFLFDYESHTPGAKARTPTEFLDALRSVLSEDDGFRERRAEAIRIFHKHRDGRARERIVEELRRECGELNRPALGAAR